MTRLSMVLALASLAGCAPAPQQAFCTTVSGPILIDKQDKLTPATQRRIIGINEIGQRLCAWKKP